MMHYLKLKLLTRFSLTKRKVIMPLEHVRLFASMIQAGISPIEALQSFGNKEYQELAQVFSAGGGYSLMFQKTSLSTHTEFIDLIESGEKVGMVPRVLDDIANIIEKSKTRIAQFIGIMIYPMLVLFITASLLILVLYFVVPSILPIIRSGGGDISFVTKSMIWASESLNSMKYVYMSFFAICIIGPLCAMKNRRFKLQIEKALLVTPKLRDLYINFNCLGYTLLLKGYVEYTRDVPGAFRKLGHETHSEYFRTTFNNIAELIEAGTPVSVAITQNNQLPAIWGVYTKAGESSSTYVEVFSSLNTYYERAFNGQVQIIVKLSEPVLMIVIGIIVGIIAYGILSPIYGLMGQFN